MARRWGRAAIVSMLLCAACGGRAVESREPSPGSGGAGGSVNAGGHGACSGDPEPCIPGCVMETDVANSEECRGGAWRCPDGMTRLSECPPGTCVVFYGPCCNLRTGETSLPFCDSNGYPGPDSCPAGSSHISSGAFCHPVECGASPVDLVDQPCDLEGATCVWDHCSGGTCACGTSGDRSVWSCQFNACP